MLPAGKQPRRYIHSQQPASRPGILSIDALRGLAMFVLAEAMHLMNVRRAFPGNRFWSSSPSTPHVPWQGCSLHDLIQPAFSFLVGAALPFSIASRAGREPELQQHARSRVWRSLR